MTTLTMWYPTTASAARRGFHEGVGEECVPVITEAAAAFDVDAGEVGRLVARWRSASAQTSRDRRAVLTPDRRTAECLAQHAPRLWSDALWAVWCVHNDIAGDQPPSSDPEASAWHVDQLLPDPPAILEVHIAEREVAVTHEPATSVGWGASARAGTVPLARVELPIDADQIVARHSVPRRISAPAAAGMARRSVVELETLVECGALVRPRDPHSPVGDPYWTIGDIFDLLDGA